MKVDAAHKKFLIIIEGVLLVIALSVLPICIAILLPFLYFLGVNINFPLFGFGTPWSNVLVASILASIYVARKIKDERIAKIFYGLIIAIFGAMAALAINMILLDLLALSAG